MFVDRLCYPDTQKWLRRHIIQIRKKLVILSQLSSLAIKTIIIISPIETKYETDLYNQFIATMGK